MNREDQLALCARAMEKFGPEFWCKPGAEWECNGAVFWTGEDAILPDGNGACNYWTTNFEIYPGYIHKELEAWADENGIFLEFYDGSTLLGYKNS